MKKICKCHTISLFSSKQLESYFKGMRIGVFDIETLGLNPTTFPMILAGLMTFDSENQCVITQYFADTPEEETEVLKCLIEDLKEVDFVLTYNGKHFDMPYIIRRAEVNNVENIEASLYTLDLYLILNGHSEIKHILENLKQKTVETYMGLAPTRYDNISGADSILLYQTYLKSKDMEEKQRLEDKILLHNHDDLLQLAKLMPIMKQANIHKALNALGFPILGSSGWPTFNVASIKRTNSGLKIKGNYYGKPFSYIAYECVSSPYYCEFKEDKSFEFTLRVDKHKGNVFINLPSYFDNFEEFKKYPNYVKNFLLICNSTTTNYLELNMFTKKFLEKFMVDETFPLITL